MRSSRNPERNGGMLTLVTTISSKEMNSDTEEDEKQIKKKVQKQLSKLETVLVE